MNVPNFAATTAHSQIFVSKAVKSSFALANELEASTRNLEIASGSSNPTWLAAVGQPTIESVDIPDTTNNSYSPGATRNTPRDRERRLSSSSGASRPSSGRAGVTAAAATAATEAHVADNLPPDSQARFLQAKVKMLTKQNEDNTELRRELKEQCSDLQRQLKTEREENKNLKKRCVILIPFVIIIISIE